MQETEVSTYCRVCARCFSGDKIKIKLVRSAYFGGAGGRNSKLRLLSIITMKKLYKPVDSFLSLKYSLRICFGRACIKPIQLTPFQILSILRKRLQKVCVSLGNSEKIIFHLS